MLNISLGAKFTSTVCFTYKDSQNLMDLLIYTFIIFFILPTESVLI